MESAYQGIPIEMGPSLGASWSTQSMQLFYRAMVEARPELGLDTAAGQVIQESHYHIRVRVRDNEDHKALTALGVELHPVPLDRQVMSGDEFYDIPLEEVDSTTWQYAVIEKNLVLPESVVWEILQAIYEPMLVEEVARAQGQSPIIVDPETGITLGMYLETCALLDNNLIEDELRAANLFDSLYYDEVNPGGRIEGKRWRFRLRSPIKLIKRVITTVKNLINSVNILSWGPRGKIEVQYDHPMASIGLELDGVPNVEVAARSVFHSRITFTERNGSFSYNLPIIGPVLYMVRFRNTNADIKIPLGAITAVRMGSPRALNIGWNLKITKGYHWAYSWASTMVAVDDYYEVLPGAPNPYNTDAPPEGLVIRVIPESWMDAQDNIINVSATGIFHGIHQNLPSGLNLNFLSHDMLLRRADGTTRTYENHYSLVIHELGHAAHWWSLHWTIQGCGVRMMATDTKVRETLADAVMQMAVHRKFYPEVAFDVNYNSDTTEGPWTTGHQQCLETVANMNDYIYIFGPDMWDEFNQSDTCRTAVSPIDDEVEEIPLIDIFRAAKDARNMTQWESEIIAKHPGKSTEISDYFNQIKSNEIL